VGGEIVSRPALDQRARRRAELVEKIAKRTAFLHVKRNIGHPDEVYDGC
jgi:hypothetical protein